MIKLIKFNQHAEPLDENTISFSFGIIIMKIGKCSFSFIMVNDKGECIPFVNLNEWRIYSISLSSYYTREKISFDYSDPTGSKQTIETGGRTINLEDDHAINGITWLLNDLFVHFHRISCFENIESVIAKKKQIEENIKTNHQGIFFDHLNMITSF